MSYDDQLEAGRSANHCPVCGAESAVGEVCSDECGDALIRAEQRRAVGDEWAEDERLERLRGCVAEAYGSDDDVVGHDDEEDAA